MEKNSFFLNKKVKVLFKKLNALVKGHNGIDKRNLVIYINLKDKHLLDKVLGDSKEHTIYGIPVRMKKEGEPILSRYEEESERLED